MHDAARPHLLGFWTCVALVVGNTIGAGVFLLPASLAPYGLNSVVAWILTACASVLLAIVFARLSRAYPEAGGPYAYVNLAFGPNDISLLAPSPATPYGDLEALQGVVKFPVRIKCATLAWNTLQQALDESAAETV